MHKANNIKRALIIVGDFILLYLALTSALFLRYGENLNYLLYKAHLLPFGINFLIWFAVFGALGLYDLRLMKNSKYFLYKLMQAMAVNAVITSLFFYFLPRFNIEPRKNLFIILVVSTIIIFLWRYVFNLFLGRAPAQKLLFFGLNAAILELAEYLLKNPQLGQKPVGFISNGGSLAANVVLPIYEYEQNFDAIINQSGADTVIITNKIKSDQTLVKSIFQMLSRGVAVLEFTALNESVTGKIPLSMIEEAWFLENLISVKKRFYGPAKRWLDILFACLAAIPFILLFPFIAIAIKIESAGPIFFKQKRIGKNGRTFELIKYRSTFRTEVGKNDGWGKEENRIYTKTGMFLRKTYLDELPQIINILRGEMSFVGPRPERPEFVAELKKITPFYEMRLLALPGITGWAQINMENDAAAEDASEKMQYDLYYVKNRSFFLDLVIGLKTFLIISQRQGR